MANNQQLLQELTSQHSPLCSVSYIPSVIHLPSTAMIKEEGIFSLWKGVIPALILVSNPMIQYTVFEKLKVPTTERTPSLTLSANHRTKKKTNANWLLPPWSSCQDDCHIDYIPLHSCQVKTSNETRLCHSLRWHHGHFSQNLSQRRDPRLLQR